MFDCVVVGGGFAGLSAAAELVAGGKDVIVLEARDRIGGRVHSYWADGQIIEVGGQWISPGNEQMHALVSESGLELVGPQEGSLLIRSQGAVFRSQSATDRAHALSPFEMADLGQGVLRFRRLADRAASDTTWATANAAWLGQPLSRWVKTNLRTPAAQQDFNEVLASISETSGDISLGQALQTSINGTDLEGLFAVSGGLKLRRVVGGMHQLADHLAGQVGTDRIRFNTVVTGIDLGPTGVSVRTSDEQTIEARTVLVTLPPWLALQLDYNPPLAAWRHEAGQRTSPGGAIKAFVVYPTPWWRETGLSGQMSADEGSVRVTFDITEPDGPGVLLGFFEGAEAAAMSKVSRSIRERAFIDSLAAVFGEVARQPHVYIDYDWVTDPYALGCHTPHFSPGIWSVSGQLLAEAAGPVHFAGAEYASKYNGYLEGALRSGRDEAKTILRELG